MIEYPHRRQRQVLGGVAIVAALLVVALAATIAPPHLAIEQAILAWMMMIGTVVAYRFPIYLRHNAKLCIFSIPLLMLSVLLPAVAAASGALLAVLAGELLVQRSRGTLLGDVLTSASRWCLLVLAASAVAHWPVPGGEVSVVAAAVVLWVGDLLTLPVLLCPITDERPLRVVQTLVREGWVMEAAQYAIGVLGVVLVRQVPWALALFVVPAVLVYIVFRKSLDRDTMALLETTADMVEKRDPHLIGHTERVAEYARGILREFGMHGQEAEQVLIAARLHDLGKMQLPDDLLLKSEALTPEDHAVIRAYPEKTAEILSAYPDLSRILDVVKSHHEAWDGSGYPAGLKGTDIPFGSRVIAVADAFDAMTHDRAHRNALTRQQAAQILRDGSGRQWDPRMVSLFLRSIDLELKDAEPGTARTVREHGAGAPERATA